MLTSAQRTALAGALAVAAGVFCMAGYAAQTYFAIEPKYDLLAPSSWILYAAAYAALVYTASHIYILSRGELADLETWKCRLAASHALVFLLYIPANVWMLEREMDEALRRRPHNALNYRIFREHPFIARRFLEDAHADIERNEGETLFAARCLQWLDPESDPRFDNPMLVTFIPR